MPVDEKLTEDLIKKVESLEREQSFLRNKNSLFRVLNENTPPQITSTQNDYDPGNYDVLRISTDTLRTITGFSGGVKGRILIVLNVGTQSLGIAHQNVLSAAANRIITQIGSGLTLLTNDSITFYYDSTDARWRVTSMVQ